MSRELTVGQLRREILAAAGCSNERFAATLGTEQHKRFTAAELRAIASEILNEDVQMNRPEIADAIHRALGREHRIGNEVLDWSDLKAIHEALCD